MLRSIIVSFIVTLALHQVVCCALNSPERKVVRMERSVDHNAENVKKASKPQSPLQIGDLSTGQHLTGETSYNIPLNFDNPHNYFLVLEYHQNFNGIVNFMSINNIENSQAVICETNRTVGVSETVVLIRMPPKSKVNLYQTVGVH